MWIKETKEGKYRLCDRYKAVDGSVHELSVLMEKNTAQEKRRATEALRARAEEIERGISSVRLNTVLKMYLKEKRGEWKASTYRRNERTLKKVLGMIGNVEINKLTAGYIRTCLLDYTTEPTTLNEYVKRLKTMLRWAYQNDYLHSTAVFDKLQLWKDKTEREKIRDKYLETDELNTLLENMDLEHWRLLTQFLALSGLRIGEAIALDDSDVDLDEKEIRVSKTYDYADKLTTTPKTLDSSREVHMQPELFATAKEMKIFFKKLKVITGLRNKYFMFSENGKRLNYDSFRQYLGDTSERVLAKRITPHYLRHTHVALMAARGIPLEVLSRRLGHGDSKITKQIYMHITKDLKTADAALFDRVSIL